MVKKVSSKKSPKPKSQSISSMKPVSSEAAPETKFEVVSTSEVEFASRGPRGSKYQDLADTILGMKPGQSVIVPADPAVVDAATQINRTAARVRSLLRQGGFEHRLRFSITTKGSIAVSVVASR